MSDIVRREAGNQPAVGGRGVQPGQQASVEVTMWEGQVLELHDLASGLPDLGGAEIASMFTALPGVVKRGGSAHRLRRGWRAQPGGITVVDVRQPLRATARGSYTPSGPWGAPDVTPYRAVGVPTRKVGDVADDPHAPSGPAGSIDGVGRPHPHDRLALSNLSYLPTSVQRSVTTGVPDHRVFVAEAVQITRGDGSRFHRVLGLRLSPAKAVLVVAAQQHGSRTWQVELFRYEFPSGTSLDTDPRAGALS